MSSQGVESLQAVYEAFAAGDLPGMLAQLDPAIEWRANDAPSYGGTYSGRDGAAEFLGKIGQAWHELAVDPEEYIDGGDLIAVRCRARGSGPGGSLDSEIMHLWRVRDDKLTFFTEYVDTARILRALGESLPADR
jgi:uncharacterized protein